MLREPAVAGQFYPGTKDALRRAIEKMAQTGAARKDAMGIVSPHAGYVYSGPVAAAVFSGVKPKGTYVILGPNHTGRGRPFSIMSEGGWKTPLGETAIDAALAKDILKRSKFLQEDAAAHAFEHSVEVQLPFIQYFAKSPGFVPIVLSSCDMATYEEIGGAIAASVTASGKDVLIIASSDFTHYEPHKTARAKDMQAIDRILALDAEGMLKKIEELDITMCGYAPVCVMLAAAGALGAKKAELVKYMTSGDSSGDYSAVVGYGGIIVS